MRVKMILLFFLILDIPLILYLLFTRSELILFNPAGPIASEQHQLFIFVVLLGLVIILPTVILIYITAFRFRHTNKKATYSPDWQSSPRLQVLLWVIPTLFVLVMVVVTWQSTHKLDPTKQLVGKDKPVAIQVVALRWKWLFIYPEENIATVNYVAFPEKTPVTFYLTADAPMSSFWIPHLAGQMYAMEGMVNRLNLMADRPGEYPGSNAEISGEGFASMRFTAQAMTKTEYEAWVIKAKSEQRPLTDTVYAELYKPSERVNPLTYSLVEEGLYNEIVMKYMANPSKSSHQVGGQAGHTASETEDHDMSTMEPMEGMSH